MNEILNSPETRPDTPNNVFNLRRLWNLIRSDAVDGYRLVLLGSAAFAATILLISVLTITMSEGGSGFYPLVYVAVLFFSGAVYASTSFKELHDKTRNEAYLLLPASALEKTISRLLVATIGFFVFVLVFLTATSAIVEGINHLVFGRHHALFDPSAAWVWKAVPQFIVVVSVFFVGSAWFRKSHFLKTVLTFIIVQLVFAALAGVVARYFLYADLFAGFNKDQIQAFYLAHQSAFGALQTTMKLLYFIALPIFCWFVAWLRVGETEVRDGV